MNQTAFNFEEFIEKEKKSQISENNEELKQNKAAEKEEESSTQEVDVQKAVVEELALEKAELREKLAEVESEYLALKTRMEKADHEIKVKSAEIFSLKSELEKAGSQIKALSSQIAAELAKEEDTQARNPNALALLDRDVDVPDRFPGETRDHVLEVIKEARDTAEKEGRIRRAQVLEGVLVSNEPNGNLAEKRANIEKLFAENGNILTGPVIEELKKLGISHKNGEEYLLPSEIIKRTY